MNKEKVLFGRALNELRKRIKNSEAKWEVFMPEQIRVFSADETLLIFKWWKELESWHTWREIELKHSGKEKYIQPLGFGKKLPKIIRHKETNYEQSSHNCR